MAVVTQRRAVTIKAWALAFLITQAIEVPVYALGLRRRGWGLAMLLGAGASALSHPLVWFVIQPVMEGRTTFAAFVVVAELFAWTSEAVYLRLADVSWRRSAVLALIANAASVTLGWFLLR